MMALVGQGNEACRLDPSIEMQGPMANWIGATWHRSHVRNDRRAEPMHRHGRQIHY